MALRLAGLLGWLCIRPNPSRELIPQEDQRSEDGRRELRVQLLLEEYKARTKEVEFHGDRINPTAAVRFFVTKPEIGDAEQDAAK